MEQFYTQMSDPFSFAKQESSTISDSSSSSGSPADSHSDEEVILASNRPKKRAGRKVFKETRHPVFRGVRRRNGDKWVCEVREPNKKTRIWLGTYPTPEMAARAHDVAALALRGKSACLNFADSSWRLPVPSSLEAKEIRRVASEAAEMFRPQEFGGSNDDHLILADQQSSVEDSTEACSDLYKSKRRSSNFQENMSFLDEETVFDMPRLIEEMAEGLLLSPPSFQGESSENWNQMEFDMSLWNY